MLKLEIIRDMILSKPLNTEQMAEAAGCSQRSIINICVGGRLLLVERKQRKNHDLFKLAIQGLYTYPGKSRLHANKHLWTLHGGSQQSATIFLRGNPGGCMEGSEGLGRR